MRLIDADALVNEFNEAQVEFDEYYKGLGRAKVITDNAPTINFMISPDYVTELQNANKELIKQLEEVERPQGEWIIEHDWVYCSSCGHEQNHQSNYCPKCGAEMQKGDKS